MSLDDRTLLGRPLKEQESAYAKATKNPYRCGLIVVVGLFLWLTSTGVGQAQELEWAKRAGGTEVDLGFGIVADGLGNSVVTGSFSDAATFGPGETQETVLTSAGSQDIFVAKYNSTGALVWARRAGGTGIDGGRGIAADGLGNSIVTGLFQGTATFGPGEAHETVLTSVGLGIFVAKYDGMGALVWVRRAGGTVFDQGLSIAIDGLGNSVVTGSFSGEATFGPGETHETVLTSAGSQDIFIAKYNSTGALVWARRAGGPGAFEDDELVDDEEGEGITVDELGSSVVTGFFRGTVTFGLGETQETVLTSAGDRDIFVARYNDMGVLVWARRAGGTDLDIGTGVAVDGLGSSYVTGRFAETATFGPGEAQETVLTSASGFLGFFVAKYDSTGALKWVRGVDGTEDSLGFGIAVDELGSSHVTGTFSGMATFGPGETHETMLTRAGRNIFVAKYDNTGVLVWARQAGGTADNEGLSLAIGGLGNSVVTGFFQDTATFGSGEAHETMLTSAGRLNIFVARYSAPHDMDSDNDGVPNAQDNCLNIPNPDQADTNRDGLGDACTHDLAILKISAPKTVTLTPRKPEQSGKITVQLQNQSPHDETIESIEKLDALVQLAVESLNTSNNCPDLGATLLPGKLNFPLVLTPKKKLTVSFEVVLNGDCIPDPLKTTKRDPGHEDYRLVATVDHSVLAGQADADPLDDVCPRTVASPFQIDPNPDGKLKDKGCGAKNSDGTFGADVLIDVVDKR